ncbi:MAG: hypothetical protein SVV03_06650 [Candidatus Nanohaloarchaea archaeon]|nr:hypothetical protein [Candidatus Nanohaloarchaea archaeon]
MSKYNKETGIHRASEGDVNVEDIDQEIVYEPDLSRELTEEINRYLEEQFPETSGNLVEDYCKALVETGHVLDHTAEDYQPFMDYLEGHTGEMTGLRSVISDIANSEKERWDLDVIEEVLPSYIHRKKRGSELLYLATMFSDDGLIEPGRAVSNVRENLEGKKILSLGDDTGSLTEVLEHFGCRATGIEHDKAKVDIAKTGILSEDNTPRQNVIQGDIWELMIPESNLAQDIDQDYDAIISYALFNIGSGVYAQDEELVSRIEDIHSGNDKIDLGNYFYLDKEDLLPLFVMETSERYLKENGISLHLKAPSLYSSSLQLNNNPKKLLREQGAVGIFPWAPTAAVYSESEDGLM